MKSSINVNIKTTLAPLALGALLLIGCDKDANSDYEVYAPVDSLAATFTVTPVPGNDTKFVITNTTKGDFVGTRWDVGKGGGAVMGKTSDTVFIHWPVPIPLKCRPWIKEVNCTAQPPLV
ncbi:hypothetical protein [Paraflavitalea speifideaquila]|uniref:hypothetical protein n=1 Tax=Paraflavitalea speifideaquila TaxID=3076558 RepID=UPI0028E4DDF2|nr:hypothetical protein [Paraflavitalea speifideiaquila]